MKLLVSACLMGLHCRYDGGCSTLPRLAELMEEYTCIPVCPEMFGGLPTPRVPAERRKDQVLNRLGEDVTDAFIQGAAEVYRLAKLYDCKAALLKEHSPSCGSGEIYDGSFGGLLVPGDGITAQTLKRYGITVYGESQIGELLPEDDVLLDTMRGLKTEIWQRPESAAPGAFPEASGESGAADSAPVPPADTAPVPPADAAPVPPANTAPVPPANAAPVPPANTAPVPPANAAPVPPANAAPVPPANAAPVPPANAAPVPPANTAPVPPAYTAPVPPANAAPVPPANAATVPPAYTAPVPPANAVPEEAAPAGDAILSDEAFYQSNPGIFDPNADWLPPSDPADLP